MPGFWNMVYGTAARSEYLLLLGFIFAAVALGVGAVVFWLLRREALKERLSRLTSPSRPPEQATRKVLVDEDATGFVTRVVTPLHKIAVPSDVSEQKKIRLLLIHAGLRSPGAYRIYLGAKVLLGLGLPLCCLAGSLFYVLSSQVLLATIGLGAVGFLFPNWAVQYLAQRRKRAIGLVLPEALDLMVVCAEAGLGLDMTFKRVGEEIRPMCKPLSDDFHMTNLEVKSGKPRHESLRNMGVRSGVQEIAELMAILTQASRFGTSVAQALRVHSESMRVRRRQKAEEKAGKLTVKLMLPLVFFIFPALFIVLLAPAAIRLAQTFTTIGGH
ncbi:MAG: type II secretion system F family protein [Deltaproteobacteria bacterium]|nr:type II secretion system F family protein [Deltaproteobacteria bacterium]